MFGVKISAEARLNFSSVCASTNVKIKRKSRVVVFLNIEASYR